MGSTIQEDEAFCKNVCYQPCLPTCDQLCPKLCPSPPVEYDFPQPPPYQWYDNDGDGSMSSSGIALICVLTFFFLGLGSCVIKRCGQGPESESSTLTTRQTENQQASSAENLNPPRLIVLTTGLPLHIIDSIKTQKYTGKNSFSGSTDCSVCLTDFEEDDMLKLLPTCNHTFHIQCIYKWLMSHTNCPLCRATVAFDQNCNTKPGEILVDQSDQGINVLQNREAVGLSNNNTKEPVNGEAAYSHSDQIQKISDNLDLKDHTDSTSSSS